MKKRICLLVLLIAVTTGMAFAQKVGDYIRFKQMSNEDDIRVLSVKKTKTGIVVEYQALRSFSKAVFSAGVNFIRERKDLPDSWFTDKNTERLKKQGKIYTLNLKYETKIWNDPIAYVEIWIEGIPSTVEMYEPTDKPVPKQPKGSWIDRAFPPLKL